MTRAMSFVYWTFGGKDISRSHKYHIVNSFYTVDKGHYRVAMVNTTLSIKHVSAETDSGPYTCQMMSEHRDEASKEVTLIVLTQGNQPGNFKELCCFKLFLVCFLIINDICNFISCIVKIFSYMEFTLFL